MPPRSKIAERSEPAEPPAATKPAEPSAPKARSDRVRRARPDAAALTTAATVALAVLVLFVLLRPGSLLANTTPTGGDLGTQVWGPDFLRHHLLTSGRWSGWSMDWYAGFPAFVFYPVLPAGFAVLIGFLVPAGLALKLTIAVGVLGLPVAGYALGRGLGLARPAPALMAVGAAVYAADSSFFANGGTLVSAVTGEYAYQLGIVLAVLALAAVARGLRTGRGRVWATVALAAALLCHPVPGVFAVIGSGVLWAATLPAAWRPRAGWIAAVTVPALAIAASWWLPFLAWRSWMTSPDFAKNTGYAHLLFPLPVFWELLIVVLAVFAVVIAFREQQRLVLGIAGIAMIAALGVFALGRGQVYNARLQPFFELPVLLLAGIGAAKGLVAVAEASRVKWHDAVERWAVAVAVCVGLIVLGAWGALPFTSKHTDAQTGETKAKVFGALPITLPPAVDWVKNGLDGYERTPDHSGLLAFRKDATNLGRDHGCGRVMWDRNVNVDLWGTSRSPALLPEWTSGCLTTITGLYSDSSPTTPFWAMTEALTSTAAETWVAGLPYAAKPDLAAALPSLRLLDVRYYFAGSQALRTAADSTPGYRRIGPVGPFVAYEIEDAALVTPLAYQPAVVTHPGDFAKLGVSYSLTPNFADAPLVASGPSAWTRVDRDATPPRTQLPPVAVTHIVATDDHVSFDVDRVGVPVLVHVSDFPTWKAGGASGPYRATPNLMVVVPTSRHVDLRSERRPVEWVGIVLALLGIAVTIALIRFHFEIEDALIPPAPRPRKRTKTRAEIRRQQRRRR